MEVDAKDDGERDERVFNSKPCEAGSGEFALFATDGREEVGFGVGEVVDVDSPFFRRLSDAEVEGIVGIGEGRDVKVFCDGVVESAFSVRFAEGEEFHLTIGVGDFGDGGDGLSRATVDVVERNRIECVAEDAWESDELDDRIGWDFCSFFIKPCGEIFADGFFRVGVDVIAVVEGEEVESIFGKQGDVREIIEIDGEHEHVVLEGVLFWGDAGVGDLAFVEERGLNRQVAKNAKLRLWKMCDGVQEQVQVWMGKETASLLDGLGLQVPATFERFAKLVGGPDAVFVEAIALPSAAVVAVGLLAGLVEFGDAGLGVDRVGGENGMLVFELVMDFFRSDFARWVNGDEIVFVFGNTLEAVHPIMRGVFSRWLDAVVPRCPSAFCARHEAWVGMNDGAVRLVVEMAEDIGFEGSGRF